MNKLKIILAITVGFLVLLTSEPDLLANSNNYQIVSEDTVWNVLAHNFGYAKFAPYSLQMIDTMIVSSGFYPRALAAYVLGKGEITDTLRCVELMIYALQNEISHPVNNGPSWRFKRPFTDVIKDQYVFNILYLLGSSNGDLIKGFIEKSHGDLRTVLVLTYGAAGAKIVREEIRNIYSQSEDSYLRLSAVKVMNNYPDSLDIPILKKALRDVYLSEDKTWMDSTAFQGTAQGALAKLGFSIEEIEEMYNNED